MTPRALPRLAALVLTAASPAPPARAPDPPTRAPRRRSPPCPRPTRSARPRWRTPSPSAARSASTGPARSRSPRSRSSCGRRRASPAGTRSTAPCPRPAPCTRSQVRLEARRVDGLAPGLYVYRPKEHALALVAAGDHKAAVMGAAGQPCVDAAAAVVCVAGDGTLAATRFGRNAERWLGMEAGFVVQNVYLTCTSLGLGTVMVGGYDEAKANVAFRLGPGMEDARPAAHRTAEVGRMAPPLDELKDRPAGGRTTSRRGRRAELGPGHLHAARRRGGPRPAAGHAGPAGPREVHRRRPSAGCSTRWSARRAGLPPDSDDDGAGAGHAPRVRARDPRPAGLRRRDRARTRPTPTRPGPRPARPTTSPACGRCSSAPSSCRAATPTSSRAAPRSPTRTSTPPTSA